MIDPKIITPSDKSDIKNEGSKLDRAGVVSPDTEQTFKPSDEGEQTRSTNKMSKTNEIEQGLNTALTKNVGKLNSQSTEEQDQEAVIENARKAELMRQGKEKTDEFTEKLEKTKGAREKQPETQEELRKSQQEQEEQIYRETKKHEEKQVKEVPEKHTAVMHGGATRESMKEEEKEKNTNLKPDNTPNAKSDKGHSQNL